MYTSKMVIEEIKDFHNDNKELNQIQNYNAINNQNKFRVKRNYNQMISIHNQLNTLNDFSKFYNKKMKLTGIEPDKKNQINYNIVRIIKPIPEIIKREMEKYHNETIAYTTKLNVSPCNCKNDLKC